MASMAVRVLKFRAANDPRLETVMRVSDGAELDLTCRDEVVHSVASDCSQVCLRNRSSDGIIARHHFVNSGLIPERASWPFHSSHFTPASLPCCALYLTITYYRAIRYIHNEDPFHEPHASVSRASSCFSHRLSPLHPRYDARHRLNPQYHLRHTAPPRHRDT